ncbi:MAG: radical SAM protein [Deltaproteobacteria bacterium]|nr:radical SAM protein [Deltaproteobacteria bacterium]
MASPVSKTDRDEVFYQLTRSVCPECRKLIDARLLIRGEQIVMRKRCPEHGWFEALVSSDAQRYVNNRRFNKPGTLPLHFEREHRGCPDSCGLCPEHQQHTCLGILEITEQCNLACPVCFASAGKRGSHLELDQIGDMLDRLRRAEGDPETVQLSGGEPLLHPQILDVLRLARDKGYRKILLNTNGIRLAEDRALLDALAETDPTVYLQFDGFEPATYEQLRGRGDLVELKQQVIDLLGERGMRVVLVATVVRGVNEHEVGSLVDFALDTEQVRCLNFQPATFSGRFGLSQLPEANDPTDRLTLDRLVQLACAQSRFDLVPDDFFPVPCPDPACSLVTYIHRRDDEVRPIPRLVDVEDYLDYIKNVSVAQITDKIKEALEGLFSISAVPGPETTEKFSCACGIDVDWGQLELEITMIGMMHFMDEHNFDLGRAQKCCVHEVLPNDGGIVPFCVHNILRRGQ